MNGTIELNVIERPSTLNVSKGKNSKVYSKIITTLAVMGETKCISLSPSELCGKDTKGKLINMRTALNRILGIAKKDYTAAVSYDDEKDIIYIWPRPRYK